MRVSALCIIILLNSGCATQPKKAFRNTAIATAVGAVAGAVLAPKGERKEAHAALWGASAGLVYSGSSLYQMSKKRAQEESDKVQKLSQELAQYKSQFDPKLVSEGVGLKESPLPKQLKTFIRPGEWKHYKLDRWVKDENQENVWVRQTELFEFVPPTIN